MVDETKFPFDPTPPAAHPVIDDHDATEHPASFTPAVDAKPAQTHAPLPEPTKASSAIVAKKAASKPLFVRVGGGAAGAPEVIKRLGDATVLIFHGGPINLFLGDDFVMGDVVEVYSDVSGAHTLMITVPEGSWIFGAGPHPLVMRLGFRLHKVSDTEWGAIGS